MEERSLIFELTINLFKELNSKSVKDFGKHRDYVIWRTEVLAKYAITRRFLIEGLGLSSRKDNVSNTASVTALQLARRNIIKEKKTGDRKE